MTINHEEAIPRVVEGRGCCRVPAADVAIG